MEELKEKIPLIGGYNKFFRYPLWSVYAPVIPTTFDNSLSLLEMLSNLLHYANKINEATNNNHTDIVNLAARIEILITMVEGWDSRIHLMEDEVETLSSLVNEFVKIVESLQEAVAEMQAIIDSLPDFESFLLKAEFDEWITDEYAPFKTMVGTHLDNVIQELNEHSERIDTLDASQVVQDARIDTLDASQAAQDARIDTLDASQAAQDARIDNAEGKIAALEESQHLQDVKIANIEIEQTEQNDRLTLVETWCANIDNAISAFRDALGIVDSIANDASNRAPMYVFFNRPTESNPITTDADFNEVKTKFNNPSNNAVFARIIYGAKNITLVCGQYIPTTDSLRFYGFDVWGGTVFALNWKSNGDIELRTNP